MKYQRIVVCILHGGRSLRSLDVSRRAGREKFQIGRGVGRVCNTIEVVDFTITQVSMHQRRVTGDMSPASTSTIGDARLQLQLNPVDATTQKDVPHCCCCSVAFDVVQTVG